MQLKPKIALWLLPLLLIQAVVLIGTSYQLYQDYVKNQIKVQTKDSLLQVKSTLQAKLQMIEADSKVLASNVVLNRYLMTAENTRAHIMYKVLAGEFESFMSVDPEYQEISLLMPNSYEEIALLTDDDLNQTDDERDTAYFRAIKASGVDYKVGIMIDPDTGRWMLVALRKLVLFDPVEKTRNSRGELKGYLVIKSNLDFLNPIVDNSSLFSEGFSLLYHDNGTRVLEQGDTRLSAEGLTILSAQEKATDAEQIIYQESLMLDAQPYLVGQVALMDNLYFSIGWPTAKLHQLLWDLGSSAIKHTAVVMLFSMLLLFWLLNRMLISPILKLDWAARQLEQGDNDWHFYSRSNDELTGLANTVKDMGQTLIRQKRDLHEIAYLDNLTRLPNRRRLLEELDLHYANSNGGPPAIALLFLDLDEFKHINDTMGHETGDAMLQAVARRLEQTLRCADIVRPLGPDEKTAHPQLARMGGDEFTILLRNIRDRTGAEAVARRILDALDAPLAVDGRELRIGASIGIALAAEVGESVSELLMSADLAMYDAKREGKNTYRFFCRSSAITSLKNLEIKDDLRRALNHNELQLAYQPQICARSGRLVGCEALLRWHHPDKGWIPPDVFIPVAEQSGLILPLGRWVILEACHQIKAWQNAGNAVPRVSVNVSFVQLLREDMHTLLHDCLTGLDLAPDCLAVEVTESSIMQGEEAISQLRKIRKSGIRVALDDFGTGYSSLSALKGLPIDELKIDKSFVTDLNQGTDGKAIMSAVIAMARQLNLEVVAEGVETDTELAYLRQKGADIIQGYYFSKPLLHSEFSAYLNQHSASRLQIVEG
ncbi:EAL domain-containing protein [uncultured Oceanisphaera sp.]|uniref:bifunctional diguanylate cyclase/phosphodiesterase n=1 Tax=uncultured Oceanisphaera sp. TaxID=353858 RepID=UPI002632FEC8|nr:EAL domain-containing protein [uncultured Oceanisphaera sp.]